MLPTGGECVYILYSRERRKSESNPTHNGPEGGRKENQVGGEREREETCYYFTMDMAMALAGGGTRQLCK